MAVKVAYFNGVRLWQVFKHWKPSIARGAQTRKMGVSRVLGKQNPHSPNFIYEIEVHTTVEPVTAISGLGRQETFNLQMLKVEKTLIDASANLGYLAWVPDSEATITPTSVSNPGAYPGTATVNYGGSPAFTPAVGQYVLLRNPSTGAGFVTLIASGGGAGPGAFTCVIPEAISTSWRVLLTAAHFTDVVFDALQGWESVTQAEDRHAFDVAYIFSSAAHPLWASAYDPDLT
jgi:hypothetical protein